MSDSFVVPQAVRDAAKRGIELRRKHGRGGLDTRQARRAGVGSGVQRASNLVQGRVSYETVKRMLAFFRRHSAYREHHKDRTSAAYISWLLWGGTPGFEWAESIVRKEEKRRSKKGLFAAFADLALKGKEPHVPEKYLSGLKGEERAKRKKEIQRRIKEGGSYKDLPGDKDAKTKPSKYSRTQLAEKVREAMKTNTKRAFIAAVNKLTGIPVRILNKVHERGAQAWATSGHRPGATQIAWSRARVYSFATGGKTQKTADADLWREYKESKKAHKALLSFLLEKARPSGGRYTRKIPYVGADGKFRYRYFYPAKEKKEREAKDPDAFSAGQTIKLLDEGGDARNFKVVAVDKQQGKVKIQGPKGKVTVVKLAELERRLKTQSRET